MKFGLIKRKGMVALYQTFIDGRHNSYEVHILRKGVYAQHFKIDLCCEQIYQNIPLKTLARSKFIPVGEYLASDSEFGKWAWCFASKSLALKCFESEVFRA